MKGASSSEEKARKNSWVLSSLLNIKKTLPLSKEQQGLLELLEEEAQAAMEALKGRDKLHREYLDSVVEAHLDSEPTQSIRTDQTLRAISSPHSNRIESPHKRKWLMEKTLKRSLFH